MTFAGRFFLRCSSYLMLKLRRSGRLVGAIVACRICLEHVNFLHLLRLFRNKLPFYCVRLIRNNKTTTSVRCIRNNENSKLRHAIKSLQMPVFSLSDFRLEKRQKIA